MPAAPTATPEHIRDVNERYHDVAAGDYDAKWGIDFGAVGREQTRRKLTNALGRTPSAPFRSGLEIGAGTGYFSLNLMLDGMLERVTATDISMRMLDTLADSAARLGLAERVQAVRTGAEELPFEDDSFDLVFGHAVLHHVPDLERAFTEFARVLRPGGVVVFCGEPSRHGDRLAALPKRVGALTAPGWRRLIGAQPVNWHGPDPVPTGHELEHEVDVHAFAPGELEELLALLGFRDVRIRGEELLANMYGWWLRSLEATARPEQVPPEWRNFAFRSYMALRRLDVALLEPRLPASLFYNLVLSARTPD